MSPHVQLLFVLQGKYSVGKIITWNNTRVSQTL